MPVRVAIAILAVIGGYVLMVRTDDERASLVAIAGLVYLFIRWNRYKRDRYQARIKS